MGRFSIEVPDTFKLVIQQHRVRECDLIEIVWPSNANRNSCRDEIFQARLAEIKALEPPDGMKKTIAEDRMIGKTGLWARGVYYYGNQYQEDEGYWDVLVDSGPVGLWLKFNGLSDGKEELLNWVISIAGSYRPRDAMNSSNVPPPHAFSLRHGFLNLPYLDQEHTYARFEDASQHLKLEIKMDETHEVERGGLAEKLSDILATGFAPGLDIDKIRSHKRKVAGLKGEEIVIRTTEHAESTLQFGWEYQGKKDSGEYPEIQITMESPDGNLDEKLKVWDAILHSFKPMYKTREDPK